MAKRGLVAASIALVAACSAVTGLSDYTICADDCGDVTTEAGGDASPTTTTGDAARDAPGSTDDASFDADANANADASVEAGCAEPLADCDGNVVGCETNLATSSANCGRCGAVCDAGTSCVARACTSAPPLRTSCKQLHDLDGVTTDGVRALAGGKTAYCNMTLAGGGWTLIANVPPAPKGYWEQNAMSLATSTFVTNLAASGMMLPTTVDGQGLGYTEVLFLDTLLNNWFTVDSASDFYRHNYQGTCGDGAVIGNKSFPAKARSTGSNLSLNAWWGNGCANGTDTVTEMGQQCANVFVNFDQNCINGAGGRVRAFVR